MKQFFGIHLAAFLAIYASSAAAKTGASELNPAEQWVVTQVKAGEIADLSKQFPDEEDKRKLSAHFVEALLTGTLPDVKPGRRGVRISRAIIEEPVDLVTAQIPCEVWLYNCKFKASASFMGASFPGTIVFQKSAFQADANFNSIKVRGTAFFDGAVFEGLADFVLADIIGNFEAKGAQFQNEEKTANFNGMKVGGAAFFNDAVFEGPAIFTVADIANGFVAEGAKFQNKEKTADFTGMKVRGTAIFTEAVFEGPASFVKAEIPILFRASGAKFQNKEKTADFTRMTVGDAFFDDAVFEGAVNLRHADFGWLDLSGSIWPKVADQFNMQGMSYKYIRAAPLSDEHKSHEVLLRLANQSAYSADVYGNLEAFFLRQGDRGDADQAFIEGKRRERREYLRGLPWLGSWLLDCLVGYGRRPWQAGIPCVFFVALGCVLFSPKKMEPQKPEDTPRVYNRFWYSLDLFLPFINLQADDVWKPKTNERFLRHYVRLHVMLGWILIPIVLAALTGLIK